jgi:glutamine amidotransferase
MSSREPAALPRVAILDYGAGNLVSIGRALEVVGARPVIATGAAALRDVDALVVPGVGAAAPAMVRLHRRGLVRAIRGWVAAGRPLLGICLGLQLLFEGSDEDGARTLGILPGRTVRLAGAPRLPHIGWNDVVRRRPHWLFDGIADGAAFYFVHSYVACPAGAGASRLVVADTTHGESFASAVARGLLAGVQFHPERSGADGLRLLRNFVTAATMGGPADAGRAVAAAGMD